MRSSQLIVPIRKIFTYCVLVMLASDRNLCIGAERQAYERKREVASSRGIRYEPGVGTTVVKGANPKDDLDLSIARMELKDVGDNDLQRRPWIRVQLENNGKRTWYSTRDAFFHGLKVSVLDASGKPLERRLNSRYSSEPAITPPRRRLITLKGGDREVFDFALGDLFHTAPGGEYRVNISWIINVYSAPHHPGAAVNDTGFSITLTSKEIVLNSSGE